MRTEVKERPILFSGPMVQAILDGRKTQTRRIIKPQPFDWQAENRDENYDCLLTHCPYGQPGDRLWLREAFRYYLDPELYCSVQYQADMAVIKPKHLDENQGIYFEEKCERNLSWKPSIHMPRWASRITLEITDMCVRRLEDITHKEALAEGIEIFPPDNENKYQTYRNYLGKSKLLTPEGSFESLWESINGPDSWNANPWVWVIEFKRVEETK